VYDNDLDVKQAEAAIERSRCLSDIWWTNENPLIDVFGESIDRRRHKIPLTSIVYDYAYTPSAIMKGPDMTELMKGHVGYHLESRTRYPFTGSDVFAISKAFGSKRTWTNNIMNVRAVSESLGLIISGQMTPESHQLQLVAYHLQFKNRRRWVGENTEYLWDSISICFDKKRRRMFSVTLKPAIDVVDHDTHVQWNNADTGKRIDSFKIETYKCHPLISVGENGRLILATRGRCTNFFAIYEEHGDGYRRRNSFRVDGIQVTDIVNFKSYILAYSDPTISGGEEGILLIDPSISGVVCRLNDHRPSRLGEDRFRFGIRDTGRGNATVNLLIIL